MKKILEGYRRGIIAKSLLLIFITLFAFSCDGFDEERENSAVTIPSDSASQSEQTDPQQNDHPSSSEEETEKIPDTEDKNEDNSEQSPQDKPDNITNPENTFQWKNSHGHGLTYNKETDSVTVVDDYGTKTYKIPRPEKFDDSRLLYQYCTPQEKYVYEAYLYAWQKSAPDKYYFKEPITSDDLREGYNAFIYDYPEAWNVSLSFQGIQLRFDEGVKEIGTEIRITLYDYEEKKGKLQPNLDELRSQFNRVVKESDTTEEKLQKLFSIVQVNGSFGLTYDYNPAAGYSSNPGHTVYDLLVNRKGVCEGFGKLFSFAARECGLGNVTSLGGFAEDYRNGQEAGHVWCAIQDTNGQWHQVDPTWYQWKGSFTNDKHRLTGASKRWWEAVKPKTNAN